MAGIGFRLQKLLSGDSYSDLIKAYVFSSVIATGPMLIVILTLTTIHYLGQAVLAPQESDFFMGLVTYCFAFSMLGVGGMLYIVTRYLADHYFHKNFEVFTPTFLTSLEIAFFFQSIVAIAFLYPILGISFHEKCVIYLLYLFINGIWLAMAFLSAAKNYLSIVSGFAVGGIGGIAAGYFLGEAFGLFGVLLGFTIGQGVIFAVLTVRIFIEFGYRRSYNFDFIFYLKEHPYLFGVGFFFNLGIWVDKFVMWSSPLGKIMGEGIILALDYDTPIFLAFMCVVPSMAFFLIQMETSFARAYIGYFKSISNREEWAAIVKNKKNILKTITENFQMFVIFQGIISGLIILLVYDIAEILELNPYQLGIFRVGLLATFLQMGFLMFVNIFFYFDFQKEAFWITVTFGGTNALFTYMTLFAGYEAYGFGFAASCFIAILMSFLMLDHKLKSLDYYTFMKQPILVPKFGLEHDWK